jgi:hypothetical protein
MRVRRWRWRIASASRSSPDEARRNPDHGNSATQFTETLRAVIDRVTDGQGRHIDAVETFVQVASVADWVPAAVGRSWLKPV